MNFSIIYFKLELGKSGFFNLCMCKIFVLLKYV